MQIDIRTCCRKLGTAEDILILCHKSPDGDTVGSAYGLAYALRSIGKRVQVRCSDPFPQRFSCFYPQQPMEEFEPNLIVAVDVADPLLLGPGLAEFADRVDLCIDHHISNTGYAADLLLDSRAAATAEVIYDVINSMGIPLNREIATALYTGIATDTGCFRYSNTTAQTHRVASALIEAGVDNGGVNARLFETKSRGRIQLEGMVLSTLDYYFGGRCAAIVLTKEMVAASGAAEDDIDGLSALPRQIEGVEAGATLREKEDGVYRVSLRTVDGVNASAICRRLGGGGHVAAAGCLIRGSREEALSTLLASVAEELGEEWPQ